MYTFGNGNLGVLGHGDEQNVSSKSPKLVSYFKENGIQVKQASLGEYFTLALSTNGSLYSWGNGGVKSTIFNLFNPSKLILTARGGSSRPWRLHDTLHSSENRLVLREKHHYLKDSDWDVPRYCSRHSRQCLYLGNWNLRNFRRRSKHEC